jgi:hypothetical protein
MVDTCCEIAELSMASSGFKEFGRLKIEHLPDGYDRAGLKIFGSVVRITMTSEGGQETSMQFAQSLFLDMLDDWREAATSTDWPVETLG